MKKLWSALAPRTRARYSKQGVSGRQYNTANKRGLRGEARAAFLNIDQSKISGASRNEFSVVRSAILLKRPDGTRTAWGKDAGGIKWEKVRTRVESQSDEMKRHLRRAKRFSSWEDYHDYIMESDDYDKDDDPLWYND